MVVRTAEEQGAAALAALAATAEGQGGSLDAADACVPPEGAVEDDDEESGRDSEGNSEPDHAHGGGGGGSASGGGGGGWTGGGGSAPAVTPAPKVADDLAAIALEADAVVGPLLVGAISTARNQRPLQRSYVKNLEAETSPGKYEPLRPVLGDSLGQLAEFRRLAGFLFIELSAVDASLDHRNGQYDTPRLLAALRELLEMSALPPSYKPSGAAGGVGPAPGLTAALASLGSSLGAAIGSHIPKAAKEEKKEERVSVKFVLRLQEVFNTRPHGETRVELYELANRTLIGHFRESLKHGVFPVDMLVAVDRMAPFATKTGAFSATDDPSMELNPKTGKVEDVSRDPKAASAASSEDYLAKVQIFFTTIAVMLHGVKCNKAPYVVVGHETEEFCSLSVCYEFLKFTATLGKVPLATLRTIMDATLQNIAEVANARVGERKSFTMALRKGLERLKERVELVRIAQPPAATSAANSSPETTTPPAAPKEAGALTSEAVAELIVSGVTAGLAKINPRQRPGKGGGKPGSPAGGRKAAADRRKRERDAEVEYDVNGTPAKRKPKRGGYDDAPRCQQKNHFKDSWCAYSHAHM